MKTTQIVIAAVVALMLLGGGFAAGMTVGKGSTAAAANASPSDRGAGRFGQGAGRGAGGAQNGQELLTGQIISVNDGSITVAVRQPGQNGASPTTSSQIILVGSGTRVVKTTETDIKTSDLKPGDQIQIVGTTDSSGSVSASAIVSGGNALQQLFGGGFGGGRGGATPTPSPTK